MATDTPEPIHSLDQVSARWAIFSLKKRWYIILFLGIIGLGAGSITQYINGKGFRASAALQMDPGTAKKEKLVLQSRDLQRKTLEQNPKLTLFFKPEKPVWELPFKVRIPVERQQIESIDFNLRFITEELFEISWKDKSGQQTQSGGLGIPVLAKGVSLRIDPNPTAGTPEPGDKFTFFLKSPLNFLREKRQHFAIKQEKQTASKIGVSFFDPDPGRARDFLQALIDTYREQNLASKRDTLEKNLQLLEDELKALEDELGLDWEAEMPQTVMQEYKELEQRSERTRESLLSLENRKTQLSLKINLFTELRKGNFNLSEDDFSLINEDDLKLSELIRSFNEMSVEFDAKGKNSADEAFRELESLRTELINLSNDKLQSNRKSLAILNRQIREKENQFSVFLDEKSKLLTEGSGTTLGEKRAMLHWGRYPVLFSHQLATRGRIASLGSEFRILEEPHLSPVPRRSQVFRSALAGLMGGLICGIVLALLVSLTSPFVHHPAAFGNLPKLTPLDQEGPSNLVAWIELNHPNFPKMIGIHSWEPREARASLGQGLAAQYALMGKKVNFLVWDSNLNLAEPAQQLPSEAEAPALATTAEWQRRKSEWMAEFEVIVLVNQPLSGSVAAQIALQTCDQNLLVAKKGETPRAEMQQLNRWLKEPAGVVLG